MKYFLSAVIGLGMVATTETAAYAWGCTAVARDGAMGYSYGYNTRNAAARRALRECSIRTYRRCRLVACRRRA
jgi:hypothetical protein